MAVAIEYRPQAVLDRLDELVRAGEQLQPALAAVGNTLVNHVHMGFRMGRDPYGNPWEAVWRGGAPLRDRGNLRDSYTYRATDDEVVVGSNRTVAYKGDIHSLAAIHQYGATIKPRTDGPGYLRFNVGGKWVTTDRTKIPARPQLPDRGLPADWEADVLDVLETHFMKGQ